ncbi:MAG TPA: peptidase C14, partial [Allocoleopsis sp.]
VSSVIAGEQPADFLFGKTQPATPTITASLTPTPAPPQRGYGLFGLGRDAIPNTLIHEDEAVKTAVNRITPQLHTLLAIKLLRLTANRGSSRLAVQATLETTAPQEKILVQQKTRCSQTQDAAFKPRAYTTDLFSGDGSTPLPIESRIRYRLENLGDDPLYFVLLGLDPSGNAIALFAKDSLIPPQDTVIVPEQISDWMIHGQTGLAETHFMISRTPFTHAYEALKVATKGDTRQILTIQNPLDVVQAALQDLHEASAAVLPKLEIPTDTYALDVNAWTTFSFVYQVVES